MKLGERAVADIQQQARYKGRREKRVFAVEAAVFHGVTPARIRQIIRTGDTDSADASKRTKQHRRTLTQEQFDYLTSLRIKRNFASWHAIEIAEAEGVISKGIISTTMLNELWRDAGFSWARLHSDRRPARRIARSAPGVMGHTDWTKWEQIFLDRDDICHYAPKKSKHSRGERLPSVWLAQGQDDYSRCAFMRLYKDENTGNHIDFYKRWFLEKENPAEFPMHGLFSQLYMDLGPVNTSRIVDNFLKGLGTFVLPTKPSTWGPYDARKHGKPERLFRTFNEYFLELPDLLPMHFDELQAWLYQKLLHYNNRRHSVTGEAPFIRWSKIENIRLAPSTEVLDFLAEDSEKREVSKYLTVSLNNRHFHFEKVRALVQASGKKVEDLVSEKVALHFPVKNFSKVTACFPTYPDMPLTQCEDADCFVKSSGDWEPTTLDLKRAEVESIDLKRTRHTGTGDRALTFLPREGSAFDETKVATKFVVDAKGNRIPSREEEVVFDNWAAAAPVLMKFGVFASPPSDADKAWLQGVISARGKIAADELLAMARQYKAEQGMVMADGDQQD